MMLSTHIACHQVIALQVRSRGGANEALLPASEELDYAVVLNRALPDDIQVLAWSDACPEFSARWAWRAHAHSAGTCS